MTFAIARHAVVDLSIVFRMSPAELDSDRLPPADLAKLTDVLTASGLKLRTPLEAEGRLAEFRHMYEPYAFSLAKFFCLDLPPWIGEENGSDNWEVSAWERGSGRHPTHPGRHF
jgi:hypothetical protein